MNFLGQGLQKLEYYRETDTLADAIENNTPPRDVHGSGRPAVRVGTSPDFCELRRVRSGRNFKKIIFVCWKIYALKVIQTRS